jgi:hypothetical protein
VQLGWIVCDVGCVPGGEDCADFGAEFFEEGYTY